MPVSWNIKYACDEVVIILYFVAWLLYRTNRVNTTTVRVFLLLAIMDIILYFYDFKMHSFGSVYFWFIGLWIFMFYRNKIKFNK